MLLLTVAEALRRERVAEAQEPAEGPAAAVGLLGRLPLASPLAPGWRPGEPGEWVPASNASSGSLEGARRR